MDVWLCVLNENKEYRHIVEKHIKTIFEQGKEEIFGSSKDYFSKNLGSLFFELLECFSKELVKPPI